MLVVEFHVALLALLQLLYCTVLYYWYICIEASFFQCAVCGECSAHSVAFWPCWLHMVTDHKHSAIVCALRIFGHFWTEQWWYQN